MNKEVILKKLRLEHLEDYCDLYEIGEFSGIEVVRSLLRFHEGMRLYVPILNNNKQLMLDVIRKNIDNKSKNELRLITGISKNRFNKLYKQVRLEQLKELSK